MKTELTLVRGDQPIALDPQAVARLASALQMSLNIQSGDRLVLILGSGHEPTNAQALETWVRRTLRENGLMPTRSALSILMVELEKHLIRWELGQ